MKVDKQLFNWLNEQIEIYQASLKNIALTESKKIHYQAKLDAFSSVFNKINIIIDEDVK
jgi:hypothetical protein